MTHISYTAEFSPEAPPAEILHTLTCHACGQPQSAQVVERITNNQLRIFCDRCGAFTTIMFTDAQARAAQVAAQHE